MKKRDILLIFISILLAASFIHSAKAAELESVSSDLQDKVDKLNDVNDKLSDEDARTEYLKQEWTKILENYPIGRFILGIGKVLSALNPVFKFFIGIEYTLSWIFFLSLLTWIAMIILFYQPIKDFLPINKGISFLIGVIITAIAAQFSVIPKFVSFMAPLFTNNWIITIGIIIGAIIIFIYSRLMRKLGNNMKKSKKAEDERRREEKANLAEKLDDIKLQTRGMK